MKLRWRFGLVAAVFLALFSLYPQMKMWYVRGAEWQGNYAYNDIDEVAYASYVKALADGRPRKNDPYTGRDDSPEHPQPESLFSIQFAAPYTLAIPARLLSISTPWMMIIGGAVAAFLTALAIFWFLFRLTANNWFAMAGSLVTLAGGALFAGEGAVSELLFDGFSYPYFPGFRRYIPALAMPAISILIGAVFEILSKRDRDIHQNKDGNATRVPTLFLLFSLAAFGYCVFSYFYIWTTAAAWLACLIGCLIIFRPDAFKRDLKNLLALGLGCGAVMLPYAYLLSKRSHTMDEVQLLVQSHAPDLTRFPEYISAAAILIIVAGIGLRKFELRSPSTLFALSLALAVFVVFNQQILTGRSLQPIHYQVFIGNYVAGLALVSSIGLFLRDRNWQTLNLPKVIFAVVSAMAIVWGFVECHYTVRVLDDVNVRRDEQIQLGRRLTELGKDDPERYKTIVLDFAIAEADDLPTIAPQATFWSRHQHIFTTVTTQENKERYFQYLHFQGITGPDLANSMKHGDFVSMIALFGWGRHTDRLNSDFKPLTYGEIDAVAREFDKWTAQFDPRLSPETIVSYVVVRGDEVPDLANFDRWYERSGGETLGPYILYKVRLRAEPIP